MFEWDEKKREDNYKKHGIDFPDISEVFHDKNHLTRLDSRYDYKEDRFQTIGQVYDILLTVIWTRRKNNIRIISARRSHKKEVTHYEKEQGKNELGKS